MVYPAMQDMTLSTDCRQVTGIAVGCTFISTAILTAALTVIGVWLLQKYKFAKRKESNSRDETAN